MNPALSIVIPVFNEATMVGLALPQLSAELDMRGWDYELLLAENGSTDGTQAALAALTRTLPRLRCLHLPEPNYGRALKAGLLAASGEVVICDEIDLCDVDFALRALPLLGADPRGVRRGFEPGVDLVVGSKAMAGAQDQRPWVRRAATRAVNLLLRAATGYTGTDTHGLKAFRRERLMPVVAACTADRDLFASELVIRAARMGCAVREIPIALREKRPPSIHLMSRVPRVLAGMVRLGFRIRR